jgi:hypothetical protein
MIFDGYIELEDFILDYRRIFNVSENFHCLLTFA